MLITGTNKTGTRPLRQNNRHEGETRARVGETARPETDGDVGGGECGGEKEEGSGGGGGEEEVGLRGLRGGGGLGGR